MCIYAGIVVFNPDISGLRENLTAIEPQVAKVVVIDNASGNGIAIRSLSQEFQGRVLLTNSSNESMSGALNRLMRWASANGATHVLLLDHDSVANAGMVSTLRGHFDSNTAIVRPYVVGRHAVVSLGPPLKPSIPALDSVPG